jgi:membrane protease subunit (stomatin/prohibitin family)
MAFLDFLSKQFIDVIDWVEEPGVLALRYPFADREIQTGAQLTVREGQVAAFVDRGLTADVFEAGLYTLETANLPILSNLLNWDKAFASPFKSDVYFFTRREQLGLKWGTTQAVTVRDPEFGALRIRAFGTYSFHVQDIAAFRARVMGTLESVHVRDLEPQLRTAIQTAMASGLGGSGTPFLDLAANQTALSEAIRSAAAPLLAPWGVVLDSFFVESLSLPAEVQAHLDKASSMRVLGDLDRYARFQAAEAIETAAGNEGGGGIAAIGANIAAGAAIAQAMGAPGSGVLAPPASAAPAEDPYAAIEKLHRLLTVGAITQAEFDAKKSELLGRIR